MRQEVSTSSQLLPLRNPKPMLLIDNQKGVEVVYTAKVTAVEDGIAKLGITATCGEDAVLGAARAEVRVD